MKLKRVKDFIKESNDDKSKDEKVIDCDQIKTDLSLYGEVECNSTETEFMLNVKKMKSNTIKDLNDINAILKTNKVFEHFPLVLDTRFASSTYTLKLKKKK